MIRYSERDLLAGCGVRDGIASIEIGDLRYPPPNWNRDSDRAVAGLSQRGPACAVGCVAALPEDEDVRVRLVAGAGAYDVDGVKRERAAVADDGRKRGGGIGGDRRIFDLCPARSQVRHDGVS